MAASPAGLLPLLRQGVEELWIVREAFDHGHVLTAGSILQSQLRGDLVRDAFGSWLERRGAVAIGLRPPALGTHAALLGREDDPVSHRAPADPCARPGKRGPIFLSRKSDAAW